MSHRASIHHSDSRESSEFDQVLGEQQNSGKESITSSRTMKKISTPKRIHKQSSISRANSHAQAQAIKGHQESSNDNNKEPNKRNSIIKMANGADLDLEGSDAEDSFVFRTATTRVSPKPGAQTKAAVEAAAAAAAAASTSATANGDRTNLATSGSGPSQCSTTSDINSDDDAISLASRLSQIVYEEQSKHQKDFKTRNDNDRDDENTSADASATELDDNCSKSSKSSNDGFICGKMRDRSSTFKLIDNIATPTNSVSDQSSDKTIRSTRKELPEIQVTKCNIRSGLLRQNSVQAPTINDVEYNDDDNSSQQSRLVDLPASRLQRSQNDQRLPERGDLRALESSRQQQQMSPTDLSNRARRPRSSTTLDCRSPNVSPNQNNVNLNIWTNYPGNYVANPGSPQHFAMPGSPMSDSDPDFLQDDGQSATINIRRSTWTLSEFDDTYNKISSNNNNDYQTNNDKQRKTSNTQKTLEHSSSTTSLGAAGDSNNYLLRHARSNGYLCGISIDPGQNANIQNNYNNNRNADSSPTIQCYQNNNNDNNNNNNYYYSQNQNANSDNLLVKATMKSQQQQNQLSPMTQFGNSANNSGTTTPTLNPVDCKCDNDQQRRASFTNSIVSFANSIESGILTPVLARRFPNWTHRNKKAKSSSSGAAKGDPNMSQWLQNPNENNNNNDDHKHGNGKKRTQCEPCDLYTLIARYVPIFEWLPNYSASYLYGDFMAGLAVAVLNISTSLSAAVVAETNLGVAFKTSIVNTFFYAILCSSRHTSFGSYSIMSQMLLVSIQRALSDELILSRLNLGPAATWKPNEYEHWHLNIIVMFTFLIGLIQLVCGLLKLGYIVASFIPEALSSSMIAATAFTMAIGQLANMCGTTNKILWSIEKNTTVLWADLKDAPVDITDLFANLFRWIQQIALLIRYYDQINMICVLISVTSVTILFLNQYFIQKQIKNYFKRNIPIPVEMILLIIMIAISHFMDLAQTHQVPTCGPIEIDFELPNVPDLRLIRELWFQALATALISYTTVHIMSKTYSNKCNYDVDSNQELIACGAGNLLGGLVDAMPAAASFSRTAGQVEAGGQTQMASIVNCVVLLLITYGLGQHVAALPVSVMAATLFYGFVRMMSKMTDVFKYWRICKVDFSIWVVSFFAILATDLVTGFVYGFIFSIITLLYRAQNRRCYMLGPIPGSPDVFVPLVKYPMATELNGCKIFQYCGPINYVSEELFESLLRAKTRVNVKRLLKTSEGREISPYDPNLNIPSHIILDFSMISFIDSSGLNILKKIIEDYQQVNINILIASMASHVARNVKKDAKLWTTYKNRFYVTLSDAVHSAMRSNRLHYCNQQISVINQNSPQNSNIYKYQQQSNQDQGQRMMITNNNDKNIVDCTQSYNNNNNNDISNPKA